MGCFLNQFRLFIKNALIATQLIIVTGVFRSKLTHRVKMGKNSEHVDPPRERFSDYWFMHFLIHINQNQDGRVFYLANGLRNG